MSFLIKPRPAISDEHKNKFLTQVDNKLYKEILWPEDLQTPTLRQYLKYPKFTLAH